MVFITLLNNSDIKAGKCYLYEVLITHSQVYMDLVENSAVSGGRQEIEEPHGM